jgi:PAS domain S-box-containing protein
VKWTRVDTEEAFRKALAKKPDLILVDYSLPSFDGPAALEVYRQLHLEIPLIVVSGTIGEEIAVECLKSGATDYVLKDNLSRLSPVVKRALEEIKIYRKSKQAEEALRVSEEKYRSLTDDVLDNSAVAIFILDFDFRVVWVNRALEDYFGLKRDKIIGKDKRQLIRERIKDIFEDPDGFVNKVFSTYDDNTYIERFECHVIANGEREERWLEHRSQPIQSGLYTGGRIEHYYDISNQKQVEKKMKEMQAQLIQSQKMEAVGTLAGGVAHDFNNLLTVIIGNAQLALMDVIKDESLRTEIEEIKNAGEKAASLTRQLLAFSRKQMIKPEILNINELLTDVEKMLGRLIGEDIELLTIPEPELWQVKIDPGQIEQVIMNLAVNARDAMPKGGKLTINTANADLNENYFREHSIKEEKPGHYVMLAVSDTGSGMNKKTREHIFDPFFTTKKVGKGTGLGLSTIYGIVKQNNGFVWVYSEPGQGSTFKVYLPMVKGDAEPEEKEQSPVDDLSGSETVLIVEDDEGLRKFAQEVLQSYGYRILVAENGEDALRVCKEHEGPIHLLLTDVVMPKMGGKQLAERLQPLYPRMKVICMSGYTDDAIVHHGVLESGLNFLEKPFTPESLARKVREALGSE